MTQGKMREENIGKHKCYTVKHASSGYPYNELTLTVK